MLKVLQHKWERDPNPWHHIQYICTKCGVLKRWDDTLGRWIYIVYSTNVTARQTANVRYDRPECVLEKFTTPKLKR